MAGGREALSPHETGRDRAPNGHGPVRPSEPIAENETPAASGLSGERKGDELTR